jgi:hypothetical protein
VWRPSASALRLIYVPQIFAPDEHLRERASSGGVMNSRPAAPPPRLPAAMCTDKALGMFVTEADAAAIGATLWWLSVGVVAGASQDSASQAQLLILTPRQTCCALLVAPP